MPQLSGSAREGSWCREPMQCQLLHRFMGTSTLLVPTPTSCCNAHITGGKTEARQGDLLVHRAQAQCSATSLGRSCHGSSLGVVRRAPGQALRRVPEQALQWAPRQALQRAPEQALRWAPRQALRRAPRQALRRAPGQALRRAPEQALHSGLGPGIQPYNTADTPA